MTERKMATVRTIAEVKDIPYADKIQAYRVDGWWVIDQKDKYSVGDMVIYCEIDSWIPTEIAPFLSRGKEPKKYNGIKGERLKTIKLKGQLSQGLLIPLNIFCSQGKMDYDDYLSLLDGDDVSEQLGITKWEMSEQEFVKRYHANPHARPGGFPWFFPKSDQERVQNIKDNVLDEWINNWDMMWEVTEKLDGSSMSVYHINIDDHVDEGVCSRTINLKDNEIPNKYWETCHKFDLLNKLKTLGRSMAMQGELVGPGVNGNHYDLHKFDFYCYNIWDIANQAWLDPEDRIEVCNQLDIKHVPVVAFKFPLYDLAKNREELLYLAESPSIINPNKQREGLVFKAHGVDGPQFKAISNKFLMEKGG